MDNNNYEQEIDLKDLLFAVLRKWRPIIVVAIVLAVLLGGYKGYKSVAAMNNQEQMEEQAQADDEALKAYELKKTGLEREIDNLLKSIEGQQVYADESILMQINPYDKYISNISLYVNTDYQIMPGSVYQNFDVTKSLLSAYASLAEGGELSSYLSDELKVEAQYLQELISVEANYDTNTLGLAVTHVSEEECNKVSALVMDFFQAKKKELASAVAEHSLNVVNEATYAAVDLELEIRQKNAYSNLTTMENSLGEKSDALSKLEEPKAAQVSMSGTIKSGIKYFILGGVLGGFMMVFFLCVGFLMSDKLGKEKELRKRFGIRILGVIHAKGKKKPLAFVDKWLDKWEGLSGQEIQEDTAYAIVAANVENYAGDAKSLLITGTVDEASLMKIKERLATGLHNNGIRLTAASNINRNPETIKLAALCDGIILVESRGGSTFTEIEKELDAFAQLEKPVIGCMVS